MIGRSFVVPLDVVEYGAVVLAVRDKGGPENVGDSLAAHPGDGVAVGPQLVIDTNGALRGLPYGRHPVSVGDWALHGPARCCSHTIRLSYD